MNNVILIAGVHGVSGRAAAEHWASFSGTRVCGLSRRSAPLPAGVEAISADLLDRRDLQRKLGTIRTCSKASSPTSAKTGSFHSRKT